jgi:hypothetical protein
MVEPDRMVCDAPDVEHVATPEAVIVTYLVPVKVVEAIAEYDAVGSALRIAQVPQRLVGLETHEVEDSDETYTPAVL